MFAAVVTAVGLLCVVTGCNGKDGGPQPADPAHPWQYGVYVQEAVTVPSVEGNEMDLAICSPSDDGGGSPAPGPFPLAILSPGFLLERIHYESWCAHLASWGYVTVIQNYSQRGFDVIQQDLADDISRIIDWVLDPANGMAGRVDGTRIAVAGHSMGGKLSVLAAIQDPRIGVVVGWDPVDEGEPSVTPELMDGLIVPLAVLGETLDQTGSFNQVCAPAEQNYQAYFDNACASERALEVTVLDADHMDWVDDREACGVLCEFCQTGPADDAHTRELTRRVTTAFFERHLRGAVDMERFLTLPGMGSGVTPRMHGQQSGCP